MRPPALSRQAFWVAAAVAVVAVAMLLEVRPWSGDEPASSPSPPTPLPTQDPTPLPTQDATPLPTQDPLPPDGALRADVTHLADGDSFTVEWIDPPPPSVVRDEVRLLAINAPERSACFGTEARQVLEDLISERPVLVEVVEEERDGFGRVIANVWTFDGILINLDMVRRGAALAITGAGPFSPQIEVAQRDARDEGRGLWTECGAAAEVEIIDLRPDATGRDDLNPNDEWIEIANRGDTSVDLTDWGVRDESTRNRFRFPYGFVLDAGARVRIRSGCGTDAPDELFWCAENPVWNNMGDTAFLVDAEGRFVDEWGYSS